MLAMSHVRDRFLTVHPADRGPTGILAGPAKAITLPSELVQFPKAPYDGFCLAVP